MVKYSVRYTTSSGGVGVINVFNSKAAAKKQLESAKKSKSFKKLVYSRPRIVKELIW